MFRDTAKQLQTQQNGGTNTNGNLNDGHKEKKIEHDAAEKWLQLAGAEKRRREKAAESLGIPGLMQIVSHDTPTQRR